jgi:hypothetical protein
MTEGCSDISVVGARNARGLLVAQLLDVALELEELGAAGRLRAR